MKMAPLPSYWTKRKSAGNRHQQLRFKKSRNADVAVGGLITKSRIARKYGIYPVDVKCENCTEACELMKWCEEFTMYKSELDEILGIKRRI